MSSPQTDSGILHDILIIGAGPCGLAVAARLQERTPSALFTDVEHQRYHWIKKHSGRMNVRTTSTKNGKCSGTAGLPGQCPLSCRYDTLVCDASSNTWMKSWRAMFRAMEIKTLRSPLFFHPDPRDRDGLLAFAYEQGREGELDEIIAVVGKELSKHRKKSKMRGAPGQRRILEINERERKDYFRPSASLFHDYCDSIIDRYGLQHAVQQAKIESIKYGFVENGEVPATEKVFSIQTSADLQYARTVVLAIGMGLVPRMPTTLSSQELDGACHSSQIVEKEFPPAHIMQKISQGRRTNVVVVGGGLTSAQIADMAIRRGVSKVWHLMRGDFKVKPFDVDVSWMAKFQNIQKGAFYSADNDKGIQPDELRMALSGTDKTLSYLERLEAILQARNGGSINPPFAKILRSHIVASRLNLLTHTTIADKHFSPFAKTWSVSVTPPTADLPPIDYIVYCTGKANDVNKIPYLEPLRQEYPIETEAGFPCLTHDLAWSDEVPLFVTGQLAALRLGPGAGNLEGARESAERVVWGLEAWLGGNRLISMRTNDSRDFNNHFELLA